MLRHPLVDQVIERLKMANNGSEETLWLLAASGGRDSTALAHLLWQAKIPFALAHMNYKLRLDESDQDEQFVRDLALLLKVPVFVECVDAAQVKGNRQAVCRNLRYSWLQALCNQHAFRGILTAHHATDQAETVLMALMKGRGLRARSGMDYKVGHVYRPLLQAPSEEIEEFVRSSQIDYRVDSSNQSLRYDRNYVRHILAPLLTARFPNWQRHLLDLSADWRSSSNRLGQSAEALTPRIIVERTQDFMCWAVNHSIHSGVYLEIARQFIPNRHFLSRLGDLLEGAPHRRLTAGDWLITRTQSELIWEKTNSATGDPNAPDTNRQTFRVAFTSPGNYTLPTQEQLLYRVWANARERSGDVREGGAQWIEAGLHAPCFLRYWQAGDRIRLPQSGGRKKVSDLLNECRVPPVRRRHVLVLVQGDEILWVLGYRNISFAGSPEEYPRQAFRLCTTASGQDSFTRTNNPQD